MTIASAAVATQTAVKQTSFVQSQIKQNAQAERQIADILTQAVESGQQAASASNGRGGIINITA